MKNILRYTIPIITFFIVMGCSKEEMNPSVSNDTCIEFVPRPVSFMSYDVSAPASKAALTEAELTELERKIATPLYFIVYDGDGERRVFETLEITDAIPSPSKILYDLYENSSFFPLTVCYLANVSYEYASSLTTKDLFDKTPLEFEYASQDETGYVGIPCMNIATEGSSEPVYENCFPICGYITQNEDGTFPGISNGIVTIPLKRLFAKVKFNLGVNMSLLGESPDSYFNLTNIRITNLPEQVLLKEAKVPSGLLTYTITESPWGVKNSTGFNFSDPININLTYDSPVIYDQDNTTEGNLKSYSFSFYAPEYALLPDEGKTATGQAGKPNLVDESVERPLYLTISGFLKHELTNSLADYKLYIGEDNDESFSIFRNNEYINNMNVTGINHLGSQGDVDNRVEVKPLNLVDIFQEAANCYVITRPGTYILDTYPGVVKDINTTEKLTGTPVEFYDPQNLITINSTGNVNQIEFTVVSGEDQFKDGNAIIALKDTNGNILWSWHIWVVSGTFLGFGDIEDHTYDYTNAVMLSRNLGASGEGELGAYYQWGRKDPFFANVSDAGVATPLNYSTGIVNEYDLDNLKYILRTDWSPVNTRWGTQKQQNDPCPPSYKVPAPSVWASESQWMTTTAASTQTGGSFLYDMNPNIHYPFSGYLDSTGKYIGESIGDIIFRSPAGEIYNLGMEVLGFNISIAEVKNLVLEIEQAGHVGMLWANDMASLEYAFYALNIGLSNLEQITDKITILSCDIKRNDYEITYKWGIIPIGWEDHWEPSFTNNVKGSDLSTVEKTLILGRLFVDTNALSDVDYKIINNSSNHAHSIQVRCVKE